MKDYNNINTFDQLIEVEHGKIGTKSRNTYEENAQKFIISEMVKEASNKSVNTYLQSLPANKYKGVLFGIPSILVR